jgi:hypothetical protein
MLFFRSGSDTDLAEKLGWALAHPDNMQTFADKAYRSLMDKHQWSIIARQYAGIFENITAKPRKPPTPTDQPHSI